MKILLICLISALSLTNCKVKAQKTCSLSVLNKSNVKIDSIKITTYGLNTTFSNVLPKKKVEKNIDIQYAGEYEGSFLARIYVKDSIKSQMTFGYYSNSNEIRPSYHIEILDDFTIKEVNYH